MSLRQGLRTAGSRTFIVLAIITSLDYLQSGGLAVLAPNIQSSFHVSTGAITFVAGISGGFLVLGIVPMGWLADRYRRPPIVAWATFVFGLMVAFTGFAINIFVFFLARLGAGVSQASTTVVHGSLLADTYPITLRGRIGAAVGMCTGTATALSPLLCGVIADQVGGPNGWRWAFYILAVPIVLVAFVAFRLKEPPRGQFEKKGVLGEVITDTPPAAPSMEAAFERIMRIRTIKTVLIAFSAIGFGLFTVPVLGNLYLKQRFGLDAFERGLIGTIGGLGVLVTLPLVGRYYDKLFRRDPQKALSLIGKVVLPVAVLVPIQYAMPNAALWAVISVPVQMLLLTAFSMIGPILTTVAPYRLRGMVTAVGGLYVFFVGAFGGAVLAAVLDSLFDVRTAVLIIMIPSTLIGALLIIRSAHFIKNDLSLGGGGDPRGDGGAQASAGQSGRHSRLAAERDRLQLRARADPLRGQLRGQTGRSPGPPRHQRGRQVDRTPGGLGPRDAQPGRGPAQWPGHHLHDARAALPAGHPPAPGRQGRLRRDDHRGEPRDGRIRLPLRQGRAPTPHRARLRVVPGVDGPPQGTGGLAVRRDAADAGAGHRHAPRSRRCSSSTSSPSGWLRSWSKSSSAWWRD